jgi:hypothetical protein
MFLSISDWLPEICGKANKSACAVSLQEGKEGAQLKDARMGIRDLGGIISILKCEIRIWRSQPIESCDNLYAA